MEEKVSFIDSQTGFTVSVAQGRRVPPCARLYCNHPAAVSCNNPAKTSVQDRDNTTSCVKSTRETVNMTNWLD